MSKKTIICILLLLLTPVSTLFAHEKPVYEGCYNPVKGHVKTLSFSPLEQLGQVRIVLKRENWHLLSSADRKRITKRLVIKGISAGKIDPTTNLLSHVISDNARRGVLFTAGDLFVPSSLDCFIDGVPRLLTGVEMINIVSGSGIYSDVESSTIYVEGTVNSCPTDPNFGKNDFHLVPNMGAVCFSAQ